MGTTETNTIENVTGVKSILNKKYQKELSSLNTLRVELLTLASEYEDIKSRIEKEDRELTFIIQKIETTDIEDPLLGDYLHSKKKREKRIKALRDEEIDCSREIQRCHYDLDEQEPAVYQLKQLILLKENNECIHTKNKSEDLTFFPPEVRDNILTEWDEDNLIYNITINYSGKYLKEISKDKARNKQGLKETVEEVVYQQRLVYDEYGFKSKKITDKYLITREIGTSDPKKFLLLILGYL